MNFKDPLKILLVVAIAIGLFFRFSNLDTKIYWGDESVTSLRVSGYTVAEYQDRVLNGGEISPQELQQYQYPNNNKNIGNTIAGLAAEEPQHPPVYYVLLKFWVQLFGDSIAITRSLSAVASLLLIPCIYFLCQELFNCKLTGWLAMGIVAISPFHILYAQEARSFSLWTFLIILSAWALLRAKRLNNRSSWSIYAVTILTSLYTLTLSAVIAFGHAIYIFLSEQFKFTKIVRQYLISSTIAVACFLPWIIVTSENAIEVGETTSWTQKNVGFAALFKTWTLNFNRIFFDLNYNFERRSLVFYLSFLFLFTLFIYSLYYLIYRDRNKTNNYLVLAIPAIVTLGIFLIPDLVFGGMRSTVFRYFIPCYLAIELIIARALAQNLMVSRDRTFPNIFWKIILIIVISLGMISNTISSQSVFWWNKYNSFALPKIAQIVGQTAEPLLVTPWHNMMAISHLLDSKVRLQSLPMGVKEANIDRTIAAIKLPPQNIFVVNSQNFVDRFLRKNPNYKIAKKYNWSKQVEPVYKTDISFWHLQKQ